MRSIADRLPLGCSGPFDLDPEGDDDVETAVRQCRYDDAARMLSAGDEIAARVLANPHDRRHLTEELDERGLRLDQGQGSWIVAAKEAEPETPWEVDPLPEYPADSDEDFGAPEAA